MYLSEIIFLVGKKSRVKITLPPSCDKTEYAVRVSPMTHPFKRGDESAPFLPKDYFKVAKNKNNILCFDFVFEYECEYVIYIDETTNPELLLDYYSLRTPIYKKSVFALKDDLFVLKPLKIDFHAHSNVSDGTTSPQEVCAYYRKAGFDVLAITDHYTTEGAKQAIEFYKDTKLNIRLYLGEETHPSPCDPHIVNWGCDKSVNDIIYNKKDEYKSQLYALIEKHKLHSFRSPITIANCIWRCNKIREFGGMAILAHPFWKLVTQTVEQEVIDYIFENKIIDAFELIGGVTVEDNNMQLNYYMEYLRKGKDIPIVGSSDSHAVNNHFNEKFTIVLSKDAEKESIVDAVKSRRTIVYEKKSTDAAPRIYSDFRYSAFGMFLIREYFPFLQIQASKEGDMMQSLCENVKSNSSV